MRLTRRKRSWTGLSRMGIRGWPRAIGRFARSREYGLVFEHNRPEAMRLYGKPIKPGDTVNVLPERGQREETGNRVPWLVGKIDKGTAMLRPVGRAQDPTGGGAYC